MLIRFVRLFLLIHFGGVGGRERRRGGKAEGEGADRRMTCGAPAHRGRGLPVESRAVRGSPPIGRHRRSAYMVRGAGWPSSRISVFI